VAKVPAAVCSSLQHTLVCACSELEYGRILAPYLNDTVNFFVISSDFCHWGARFGYQLYDPAQARRIQAHVPLAKTA
jgi:predicted class III extradiol MEMO1 family dioxygenase